MTDELSPPEIEGLRYLQPLGSGGYSEVYLYEQQRPRMNVAVKVLNAPDVSDAMRRQFTAEGDAMATLADHPYIVQVFRADFGRDGRPYLVMKYYPQPNLGQRARDERLAVAEVLRIGIQISSAVETAHRAGILHRDIKPANILTGQYGNPGLTDFGIAATTTEIAGADGLSVPWSPPEVLFASSTPDVRSDVYSLGATVWHLLTGRSPFAEPGGDNRTVTLMRRILDAAPRPTGRADVPESLDRLLVQSMSKQIELRPSSALNFALGLQRVEQQLRLPLTQIVVPADPSTSRSSVRSSDFDATFVRTPRPIAAQGPDPVAVKTAPAPATQPARVTIAVDPPPRRRSRRPYAIAALALAVLAAVVVGFQLSSGGNDPQAAATTSPATDQVAIPVAAPGVATVTVQDVGNEHVRFDWTYENSLKTDSFLWRRSGTTRNTRLNASHVTLARTTAPVCIEVQVFRADGSAASAWSSPKCSA